ncbi:MAG: hypothetical protein A2036_03460 [Omnitrophica bacterium GWA2_50_21]|nr:MAG: hypothetical protein A2036_03460 [Omnitrophica bacterium GWA2_50_21]
MRKARKKIIEAKQVIDPVDLVIQEIPSGIQLWSYGRPILLPNGNPLTHPRQTLVEHIREEFSGFGTMTLDASGRVLKPDILSSYILLGVQQSMEADPNHPFMTGFGKWLLLDPCLSSCAGPERVDQKARWLPLSRYFEAKGIHAPDFAQIPVDVGENDDVDTILRRQVEPMFGLDNPEADKIIRSSKAFVEVVVRDFKQLGPEEWTVMFCLFQFHQAVLFPLLLVTGRCTAQEYANGLMAAHCLLTTAFSDVDDEQHEEQTRGYREDAQVVLQFLERARCPWAKEILKGESKTQEFKATLRYDLKTGQHNKELEHAVLKNIAGLLNGQGGTIFVGVRDDGEICGIELDDLGNQDQWTLHLVNRIGQQIGKRFITLCLIDFDILHGKVVSRITVRPSTEPVFLDECALKTKGDKRAFFIRGGPSAQKLTPEETTLYITKRFQSLPISTSES